MLQQNSLQGVPRPHLTNLVDLANLGRFCRVPSTWAGGGPAKERLSPSLARIQEDILG